jgi:hypothetical protein
LFYEKGSPIRRGSLIAALKKDPEFGLVFGLSRKNHPYKLQVVRGNQDPAFPGGELGHGRLVINPMHSVRADLETDICLVPSRVDYAKGIHSKQHNILDT